MTKTALIQRIRLLEMYLREGLISEDDFVAGIVKASNEYQNRKLICNPEIVNYVSGKPNG